MFLWIPDHPDQIGIWKCWFLSRGIRSTPRKNLSEQGREPITNSANVIFCRQLCNANLGHIGGRLVVSPLHHSPLSLLERLLIQSVASLFKEQVTTLHCMSDSKIPRDSHIYRALTRSVHTLYSSSTQRLKFTLVLIFRYLQKEQRTFQRQVLFPIVL